MSDPSPPLRLEYRLTEADVHHYCSAGLAGKCWRSCRGRKVAVLLLVALGFFLVGICFHSQGVRAGGLALGTALAVLAALAWARESRYEGGVCRLARQMGLPRDLLLIVGPAGVAEQEPADPDAPPRMFAWSEVTDVSRVDHLTVFHLRPAGGVLIVPDSVFGSPESRASFQTSVRSWRFRDESSKPPIMEAATP